MKNKKNYITILLLAASAFLFAPITQADDHEGMTITEVVTDNPDFTILYTALSLTGLDAALDGKRQFTVFAPSDAAFAQTAADLDISLDELVMNLVGNLDALTEILLYHVAPGERMAADVVPAERIRTLNKMFITKESGSAVLDNAPVEVTIIAPDAVDASNGIIHLIDRVLLPPEM